MISACGWFENCLTYAGDSSEESVVDPDILYLDVRGDWG